MNHIQKVEKLNYLLELISKGNCGDALCLARRMHVSVRTIKTYISILRDFGHSIHFDSITKTYFVINKDHQIGEYNPINDPIIKMA